ncbi:MAG TPA: Ig-like domain repeat protein [Pyrinomonadaceae bacterium]
MKRSIPTYRYRASRVLSFVVFLVTLSLVTNPLVVLAARTDGRGAAPSQNRQYGGDNNRHKVMIGSDDLAPAVVFSNPALITILDTGATAQSTISVSGLVGSISTITLTLTNLNTPRSGQLQFLLVGPGGQTFVFLSDAGGAATATAGATITFSDAAASGLTQAGAIPSGTFKPTDFDLSPAFPAPAPAGPYNHAQPFGAATFTSVFGGLSGASVNGNWNLYAYDDGAGGGNSTVNGGWSLDITVAAAAATTTTLMSSANPSFTNQAITLTSTTTSTSTVNTGVVDFFDNTTSLLLCNDVPVNGSGVAACVVPANTLSERIHNITATYVGNATFATSNGSINQTVNTPTVISGGGTVFTNPGGITISDSGASPPAVPYPSNIIVSGLSGTVSKVTLTLTNFSAPRTNDINFLLRGPGGQTYVFMSDAGGAVATAGATLTFDDAGASQLPNSGALMSGTFRPTDYAVDPDTFPAPAPAGPYPSAPPAGSSTLATVFGGAAPNGTWSLFAIDDGGGGGTSTVGSWSLTFITTTAAPTTTVVSGSPNPAFTNQAVLFTATVTSTSTVNTGTVTFRHGLTVLCNAVPVNGSGVATCNVSAGTLPQGDLTISADYNGSPGVFNISTGSTVQQINSPTVRTGTNFANNGGITINDASVASPYPSRIFVTGLGGTITKVTVSLNGLTTTAPDHFDLLLVGPGGQKFLFMGDAGGTNAISGVNLTLDDAAASQLPDSTTLTSGTFRPTSYTGDPDVFPAPAPAGPYNPAAPEGAGTFANVFNGIVPNGTWSLYAVEDQGNGGNTTLTGWSLTFTLAPATTTTTVTSSANPSVFGQPVTFTATVATAGLGTPSGNVQFFDGATPIGGPVALNVSGQAQVMISSLSVGNHTITAQYAGDVPSGFSASSGSLAGGQQVNPANTSTVVSSNLNPSNTGQQVTFTATVAAQAPSAAMVGANGTVTFFRDGQAFCANTALNASGQATCQLTFTVAASYNITAAYSGTVNFNASNNNSAPLVQVVTGPTAANAAVSGRVMDLSGRGVGGAHVTMQDQAGSVMSAVTNPFGYYHFTSVPSGQSYLISVRHKRYQFQTRAVTVNEDLADIDFIEEGGSRGVPGKATNRLSDRIP